jgi:signal transduction histidine kinase
MATEPSNPALPGDVPASDRFSFRRLIRYSIGLQIFVIAVVLSVTLWGALQTQEKSEQFAKESSNVLLMTGQNQEFDRARRALRDYVKSGNAVFLGAYTQSTSQINRIAFLIQNTLTPPTKQHVQRYSEMQLEYLNSIGSAAIAATRDGDRKKAGAILSADGALTQLNEISEMNVRINRELTRRQQSAEQAVSRRQAVNAFLIVLSGLVILGTGIGLLMWLRSQTMVPLENLAVASRKLGHGDLSARVEPGGVEEIALSGSAFNQMADEIEQHVGQLHDLSLARSRFVSSVSHELRTPITSLRGYLELLEQGEAGPLSSEQERYLKIADRNARQLSDLIDDLLTLSRVQSGRASVKSDDVNVRELLRDLKAEMLPIGSERGVDIVLVDTGELIVSGDPLRLRQAFGNLLNNSVKYSRDGQAVVVRAFAVNRQAVISFVDWGMGIPREDLPQIAEPFFRSESSENVPGTGLGLAIAKQMIELHGGRLAVESELGGGSTFTVYLPLHAVSGEPARRGQLDEMIADSPATVESATTTGE